MRPRHIGPRRSEPGLGGRGIGVCADPMRVRISGRAERRLRRRQQRARRFVLLQAGVELIVRKRNFPQRLITGFLDRIGRGSLLRLRLKQPVPEQPTLIERPIEVQEDTRLRLLTP